MAVIHVHLRGHWPVVFYRAAFLALAFSTAGTGAFGHAQGWLPGQQAAGRATEGNGSVWHSAAPLSSHEDALPPVNGPASLQSERSPKIVMLRVLLFRLPRRAPSVHSAQCLT